MKKLIYKINLTSAYTECPYCGQTNGEIENGIDLLNNQLFICSHCGNEMQGIGHTEEIQTVSDMKDCFCYYGRNDFVITDKDIFDLKKGLIINASIEGEYSFTLRYKPNENKEKLITKWLIDNIFRNDDYYTLHDEETTNDLIWNLMEIISSLHNEYYKAIHGQYYDYMFHWVNKTTGGSIVDDIFKEFKE